MEIHEKRDIVLYNGDEISVFYDSNSWSYTRLGRITGKSKADLKELLGKDSVTIELTMEEEASNTMVVYFSQTGSTKGRELLVFAPPIHWIKAVLSMLL